MNAKFMMSFCSYASRRAGSNLLALIGALAVIRNAHGNWRAADVVRNAATEMADVHGGERNGQCQGEDPCSTHHTACDETP